MKYQVHIENIKIFVIGRREVSIGGVFSFVVLCKCNPSLGALTLDSYLRFSCST